MKIEEQKKAVRSGYDMDIIPSDLATFGEMCIRDRQNRRNDDLFTGMGYWTRANAEICILATKGHPKRCLLYTSGSALMSSTHIVG